MDAGRHPLIDVVTNAEVVGCEGTPGEFRVRVRRHPRFVREDRCVACGLCVDACPQVGGNEFDVGLKARFQFSLLGESRPFTGMAEIVRRNDDPSQGPRGFGMRFLSFEDPEAEKRLEECLSKLKS